MFWGCSSSKLFSVPAGIQWLDWDTQWLARAKKITESWPWRLVSRSDQMRGFKSRYLVVFPWCFWTGMDGPEELRNSVPWVSYSVVRSTFLFHPLQSSPPKITFYFCASFKIMSGQNFMECTFILENLSNLEYKNFK